MVKKAQLSRIVICIRGGGDIASGVAWRLYHCGFRIFITEIDRPMAVRRKVAFCEAVYDGRAMVQGVEAIRAKRVDEFAGIWEEKKIPLLVDPSCESRNEVKPDALVDAVLAKRNLGTSVNDAPLVIALGPGFKVGKDSHFVVETNRGHNLGRLLTEGAAEPNTGIPGAVQGITTDRVLRAPADGLWLNQKDIGEFVKKGDLMGSVEGLPVEARIEGVLRGMIRPGIPVKEGLKIGDIDPRGKREYCYTVSEKALAIGGGVLEGILRIYGR